jgi:hypothetical protein
MSRDPSGMFFPTLGTEWGGEVGFGRAGLAQTD